MFSHIFARRLPPVVGLLTLVLFTVLTLAACSSTTGETGAASERVADSDEASDGSGQDEGDDQLAAVSDGEDGDLASGTDEDLNGSDRLDSIDEPPPPAVVPTDVEGSLACAKVESALLAAEVGDTEAINAELSLARERLTQAGPVIAEAGPDLIPTSADAEDWQENAYDFLDVCASTGYEPFIARPDSATGN